MCEDVLSKSGSILREVSLNFGSAGCRGIGWMFGKCVEIFNCICSGFSPVTGSPRNTLMVGVHFYSIVV